MNHCKRTITNPSQDALSEEVRKHVFYCRVKQQRLLFSSSSLLQGYLVTKNIFPRRPVCPFARTPSGPNLQQSSPARRENHGGPQTPLNIFRSADRAARLGLSALRCHKTLFGTRSPVHIYLPGTCWTAPMLNLVVSNSLYGGLSICLPADLGCRLNSTHP
jgi:hypothetical protein